MKVYVSLPLELGFEATSKLWNRFCCKAKEEFQDAELASNYLGDEILDDTDVVIFLYEYRDYPSCQSDYERCKKLNKIFNFFTKVYTPERGVDY